MDMPQTGSNGSCITLNNATPPCQGSEFFDTGMAGEIAALPAPSGGVPDREASMRLSIDGRRARADVASFLLHTLVRNSLYIIDFVALQTEETMAWLVGAAAIWLPWLVALLPGLLPPGTSAMKSQSMVRHMVSRAIGK